MSTSNRFIFLIISFILVVTIAAAKPVLNKSKYLIATSLDNGSGVVSPSVDETYQLAYYADRNDENALDTDYWIIKNISGNQYSFQNAATGKFIKYNSSALSDRSALTLIDALQIDNSTSFTLEHNQIGSVSYYLIRSVINPAKIWNRRSLLANTVYPVGVYSGSGASNEQFVFYDNSGSAVIDDGQVIIPLNSNRTLGAFSTFLQSLTINGKTPVVDTPNKEFYVSLPENMLPTTNLKLSVSYIPKNPAFKLFINENEVISGSEFILPTVSGNQSCSIEIKYNSTSLKTCKLYFSSLPLVQIFTDVTIGSVYILGRLAVTEPLKTDTTEVILTKFKTRGAISLKYAKKNYSLNIRDSIGKESDDRSFFNLRNDNNWILEAMFIDPARMRNRVSIDLWNDFATKPYWYVNEPKLRNGTRGHFVEVFQNDVYQGLYCMTERIDRKQLNLKKIKVDTISKLTTFTQRGALYKAVNWTTAVMFGCPVNGTSTIPSYNNTSGSWSSFECKYPEFDEGEPISWDNLYKAIQFASEYYSSNTTFLNNVNGTFDLPVFLDYYLFLELMLATDNQSKNTYYSIYDQTVSSEVSLTPWDLDGTWGLRWDGSKNITFPNQNYESFLINSEMGVNNVFIRMKKLDVDNWSTYKLRERYRELRKDFFSHDSLMSRFRHNADIFIKSGADIREIAKWGNGGFVKDIEQEMNYLSNWIAERLLYLDNQYLGRPYTSIQNHTLSFTCGPNPVSDNLYITGTSTGEKVKIYNLQGVLLQTIHSTGCNLTIDMSSFQSGVYLIKSGLNFIRIVKS